MKATAPWVEVPGDNTEIDEERPWLRPHIMGRSGDCLGMSPELAVWRFGFGTRSESKEAFGVYFTGDFFLWVLATRKTGKVKETWEGAACDLPTHFRRVLDWEPQSGAKPVARVAVRRRF